MTAFACKTRDASGTLVERTIDAESKRDALLQLEQGGLFPITITEIEAERKARGAATTSSTTADRPSETTEFGDGVTKLKIKGKALLQFSLQLSSFISAGVPIISALRSIGQYSDSEDLKAVVEHLVIDIENGLPLSAAMMKHPRAFPQVYANTIAAGEQSGMIDKMLNNLTEFLEAEMEMKSDVRSALLYPAMVISTLIIAISVLIIFVVPRFASFYSGFNAELPLPTKILINGSTTLSEYFPLVLVGLALTGYGAFRFAHTVTGKNFIDRAVLKIPVVGGVIETAVCLQVIQMIGLFTQAGVPILEGLETIARATSNTKIKRDLNVVVRGVATGETLTASMEEAGCFPPTARQMLASGESTGSLERSCFEVAKHYKKDLRYKTKNLATLIEPMMTLVLAVVVLFVALAAFLPMWDLVKIVGK